MTLYGSSGRRVLVTGIGLVTPLACGTAATWGAVVRGDIAVAPLKQFDASALPVTIAAEVDRSQLPPVPPLLSPMPDSSRFALVAAEEALLDAGLLHSCIHGKSST